MEETRRERLMSDGLSFHSSSNATVHPVYLDGRVTRGSSIGDAAFLLESQRFQTPQSMDTQVISNRSAPAERNGDHSGRNPPSTPEGHAEHSGIWMALRSGAQRAVRRAADGAGRFLEHLLEPRDNQNNEENALAVQVVHMNEPFLGENQARAANLSIGVNPDTNEDGEESESEEIDPLLVEIDLISTLQAYRKNPNECIGHLVAAALSSRSAENPVTAEELKEARLNPYLVRMVIDSQHLDIEDKSVQEEVQRCVDSIIPAEVRRLPHGVYDYLPSLFKLHFLRLNSEQYAVLKESGFEFVKLLCEHPHVLPPGRLNSIRLNYVQPTWYIDTFIMVVNMLTEVVCVVSIMWLLLYSVLDDGNTLYQTIGFYMAILYGIGYAAHLISMIFLMRGRERDTLYGETFPFFPSPHLLVLPVVPFYNIVTLITFVRYRLANRHAKYVAVLHDILVAQTLSSLCFSLCVAIPQLIYQTYVTSGGVNVPEEAGPQCSFKLLAISAILTVLISILRIFRVIATFDSINQFGFACFGLYRDRIIERHSALPRVVCASSLFVLELNIFFAVAGALNLSQCGSSMITTLALSGVSVLVLLVALAFLFFSRRSVYRIMWSMLPLSALQIALLVHHQTSRVEACEILVLLRGGELPFPYVIWALSAFFLVLWLLQLLVLRVRKLRDLLL